MTLRDTCDDDMGCESRFGTAQNKRRLVMCINPQDQGRLWGYIGAWEGVVTQWGGRFRSLKRGDKAINIDVKVLPPEFKRSNNSRGTRFCRRHLVYGRFGSIRRLIGGRGREEMWVKEIGDKTFGTYRLTNDTCNQFTNCFLDMIIETRTTIDLYSTV